ncbi:MAG: DnaJ C-terminal domain-containing protein, partial [Nitriliruptorales bacterium]|nr:DnaJ C-terminal domain-containing protein [Nitriliruptorales bacterium]
GGDEETFKQVTHAYQVLTDGDRRARYDRTGDDGTTATRGTSDPFGFGAAGFGGLNDVFESFFGSAFGGSGTRRRSGDGRDVLVGVDITLEDVLEGSRVKVPVEVNGLCDNCGGSGSESGQAPETCGTCKGRGQVQQVVRTAFGQMAASQTCPTCRGVGRSASDPCRACAGAGRRPIRRAVTVDVPAGVEEGDRLRVTGAGEAGLNGGPAGDLYVEVHVRPHDVFERDGRDLWAELPISVTQAILGAQLTVPALGGDELDIDIPAGTQPGEVLTLRRAGLPVKGGGQRGDFHVQVRVVVPRNLDADELALVEQLAERRGDDVGEPGRGLFERLREVFR